ncbi:hypothetical protein BC826DRAFT_965189 [Russula brevipes]|nr:hypothetical protein BC826DRAFT_965189 [Russula brevipes]
MRVMLNAGRPALLAALSFLLTTNPSDLLFGDVLGALQVLARAAGFLALPAPRDAFLTALAKATFPPHSQAQPTGGGGVVQPQLPGLSPCNLECARALVAAALFLVGMLGPSWFAVLEALQNADYDLTHMQHRSAGAGRRARRGGSRQQIQQLRQQVAHPLLADVDSDVPVWTDHLKVNVMLLKAHLDKVFGTVRLDVATHGGGQSNCLAAMDVWVGLRKEERWYAPFVGSWWVFKGNMNSNFQEVGDRYDAQELSNYCVVNGHFLPVLRAFVNNGDATSHVLFFSLLYPPSALLAGDPPREGLHVVDRTAEVPGYSETSSDLSESILNRVKQAPDGPLTVVIDAADVLCADLEAPSKSYALISSLLSNVLTHPKPSRLVLHFSTSSSPLRDLVLAPRLSPTLAHIVAHPPALLTHLATAQLTPPPPLSAPERFWRVFAPLSARAWEVERIVLGPGGAGPSGGGGGEIVLEVLTRAPEGRRGRNVERELEGWTAGGPCPLSDLDGLKPILEDDGKRRWAEVTSDVTSEVSFNLNLTPEQRKSRAKVPLPYAHKGDSEKESSGAILYDPDSADDIDDDDPDEDLDI